MDKPKPRRKMRVGTREIAAAAGVAYRTALRHERKEQRYRYGDLGSVAEYIAEWRGMVWPE